MGPDLLWLQRAFAAQLPAAFMAPPPWRPGQIPVSHCLSPSAILGQKEYTWARSRSIPGGLGGISASPSTAACNAGHSVMVWPGRKQTDSLSSRSRFRLQRRKLLHGESGNAGLDYSGLTCTRPAGECDALSPRLSNATLASGDMLRVLESRGEYRRCSPQKYVDARRRLRRRSFTTDGFTCDGVI